MDLLIFLSAFLWMGWLIYEKRRTRQARKRISHVIHVNGTRGKSSTCRLIEAGLRAGGLRVYCKTTGTDPMTIDVFGEEKPIQRRGKANIKEQIQILQKAARQNADVFIVECMALLPELQYAAQHSILEADIGVITNVRRDHTDVMGQTLSEICEALCNTVPKNGLLFTGEQALAGQIEEVCKKMACEFHGITPDGSEPEFDFAENIALALSVCEYLGVDRETALTAMQNYRRDPYALSLHRINGALYIDGLSINDIQSICMVWEQIKQKHRLQDKKLILLINNRADRGTRTKDMLEACLALTPSQVWLLGASQMYMRVQLSRKLPNTEIRFFHSSDELDFSILNETHVLFAIGNIAGAGRALVDRVHREGIPFVQ